MYICIVVLMPVMEFNPSWIEDIEMLCIVGPTASGKTRFAVWCAHEIERLKGVKAQIISADSRQVYKDMTLGTGKDLSEYGSVPYHLIDIAEAGEKYNLFQFKRDFQRAYSQTIAAGDFPILCGGSGLYVEAVLKDYDLKAVAPDASLRAELEKKSMEELVQMLTDLKAAKGTVPHNVTDFDTKKRVIRAIEIERAGFGNESEGIGPGKELRIKVLGLNPPRDARNARIDRRLEERLQSGMVEEVKALLDKGIAPDDLIYYGLEYKFITKYLQGEFSYEYMKEHLAIAIHQFAKRQMTWLRGMERRGIPIEWIEQTHREEKKN